MARFGYYEFFAGGGMARAGIGPRWDCLFANDFDPKKVAAYAANWGDAEILCGDVARLHPHQLPRVADLVWASFPCQDLSLAGNGAGLGGARSGCFWPFWQLICDIIAEGRKPHSIVLENVGGLLSSKNGADFSALCEAVAQQGYWVGAIMADAKDFLPQSRPRLFVIALNQEFAVPGRIQSGLPSNHWHPARLRAAHANLNEDAKSRWLWFTPPIPAARNVSLADIVDENSTDIAWHSPAETLRLLELMSPVNRAKVELVIQNKLSTVGAIYKRTRVEQGRKQQRAEIRFDLAGCLRTPGGGSSRQQILVSRNGQIRTRLISARETALLMGLSQDYILPTRYNDAYHLTGDGVAVPVVRHIIANLIEPALAQPALQQTAVA